MPSRFLKWVYHVLIWSSPVKQVIWSAFDFFFPLISLNRFQAQLCCIPSLLPHFWKFSQSVLPLAACHTLQRVLSLLLLTAIYSKESCLHCCQLVSSFACSFVSFSADSWPSFHDNCTSGCSGTRDGQHETKTSPPPSRWRHKQYLS